MPTSSDAFVWYNKNVQKLFEIVVCPTIPFRFPRISHPYVLGSIFTQRKWKTLTGEEHLPKIIDGYRVYSKHEADRYLGCREMGGIYLGNIICAPKIDVFLFAPRPGPIRSVKALGTYYSWQHTGRCLPQILDTQATTMDTMAQFCSSHGHTTEAFHSTHYTGRQNEVGVGLTYQQF